MQRNMRFYDREQDYRMRKHLFDDAEDFQGQEGAAVRTEYGRAAGEAFQTFSA